MKFVSVKNVGNRRLECTAPLDTQLIKGLELDHNDMFTFTYDLTELKTEYQVAFIKAAFVVKITPEDAIASATVYITKDEGNPAANRLLEDYGTRYGDISCLVELTDEENTLLQQMISNYRNG